jgi:hypothetical protein
MLSCVEQPRWSKNSRKRKKRREKIEAWSNPRVAQEGKKSESRMDGRSEKGGVFGVFRGLFEILREELRCVVEVLCFAPPRVVVKWVC